MCVLSQSQDIISEVIFLWDEIVRHMSSMRHKADDEYGKSLREIVGIKSSEF